RPGRIAQPRTQPASAADAIAPLARARAAAGHAPGTARPGPRRTREQPGRRAGPPERRVVFGTEPRCRRLPGLLRAAQRDEAAAMARTGHHRDLPAAARHARLHGLPAGDRAAARIRPLPPAVAG